jgi:hypothetical protein
VTHTDMGEAAWVRALREAAWVPTTAGTLEPPANVSLEGMASAPNPKPQSPIPEP